MKKDPITGAEVLVSSHGTMSHDAMSYNDETDYKRDWSVRFTNQTSTYQKVLDMIQSGNLEKMEEFRTWTDTLSQAGGYERIWSDDFCYCI